MTTSTENTLLDCILTPDVDIPLNGRPGFNYPDHAPPGGMIFPEYELTLTAEYLEKLPKEVDYSPPPGIIPPDQHSDMYRKFRGQCLPLSLAVVREHPDWRLVRGFVECPFNGREQHWWTERPDGSIFDPSIRQYNAPGLLSYEEYEGVLSCFGCGVDVNEKDAVSDGSHRYCTESCLRYTIGV